MFLSQQINNEAPSISHIIVSCRDIFLLMALITLLFFFLNESLSLLFKPHNPEHFQLGSWRLWLTDVEVVLSTL